MPAITTESISDVMRLYFELGAPRVVGGGFYAWFGRPLEAVIEDIGDRALAYAAAQPRIRRAGSASTCATGTSWIPAR